MIEIEQGILRFTVHTQEWGDVPIMRPTPTEESSWGVLAPLEGSFWEDLIPVISGETMSHALHGRSLPFVRAMGRPPRALLKMIPDGHRQCANFTRCVMADDRVCHPCSELPLCYVAPGRPEEQSVVSPETLVVKAWAEGRYVLVVEGDEFSL